MPYRTTKNIFFGFKGIAQAIGSGGDFTLGFIGSVVITVSVLGVLELAP